MSRLVTTGGSLFGLVTDVQVFNRMLSDEEAIGYTACRQELNGDIASWENEHDWEKVGNINEVKIDSERICLSESSIVENVMIIPALLTYPGKFIYFRKFNQLSLSRWSGNV